VLSDLAQGMGLLEECTGGHNARGTGAPIVILVTLREQEVDVQPAMQRGVAEWFSVQCQQQEIISAVRRLGARPASGRAFERFWRFTGLAGRRRWQRTERPHRS
jgi:DNA-binding NarL/FixJ family response regulator